VPNVAAYQVPLLPAGSMEAIDLIADQVKACESVGVELLCCPEGVLGGLADYAPRPHDIALDARTGELERALAPLASPSVTVIVGFTEIDDGRLYNAAAVARAGRVLGVARKINPAINRSVYSPGRDAPVFRVGGLTFGVLICRDSTYPELAERLVRGGATVLFVPTNNGLPPKKSGADVVEHARRTDLARARERSVPVVRADVTGRVDGLESYGTSAVVDHRGVLVTTAEPFRVELLVAEIDAPARSVDPPSCTSPGTLA
jgi:predicted amidohydrolase